MSKGYLHDMSKQELIDHIEKMQEHLTEIHRLEEENKEIRRVNKLKHELYQEQKERADRLDRGLDKVMRFIDDHVTLGFACPYEIDSEEYMINWPKCSKCGSLVGQEHDCWKEWCLENVD